MEGMSEKEAPLILAIETATRAGSVSLARGEEILSTVNGDASSSHSTDLLENVEKVLRSGGVKLDDIDFFAAAKGPGSFTGLRIGLATIKSFAVCTGRRCAGVSTLAAIAYAAGASNRNTVALLPAGRGEVFAQMFSVHEDRIESLDSASHITPEEVLQRYGGLSGLIWAGEGAQLHYEKLRAWAKMHDLEFVGHDANGLSDREHTWTVVRASEQLAIAVAMLGLNEYRKGNLVDPNELRAAYVRPSDAEIPKPWQQQK